MTNTATTAWDTPFDMARFKEDWKKALEQCLRVPPPIPNIVLTQRQADALTEYACQESYQNDGPEFISRQVQRLCGIEIVIVEPEPSGHMVRSGRIIQKDRFVEYSAEDMVWAEPLGLAEWEMVDREHVVFGLSKRLMENVDVQFSSDILDFEYFDRKRDVSFAEFVS